MSEEMTVLTDIDARGVARIVLNRPEVRNAMNAAFIRDLTEAVEERSARTRACGPSS